MKKWTYILGLLVVWAACSQPTEQSEESTAVVLPVTEQQAQTILSSYFEIKDALVASDPEKAGSQIQHMSGMLGEGDSEFHQAVSSSLEAMGSAEDLEAQRVAFEDLSKAMDILRSAWEGPVYKQYCPMAFDNEGAYWYSAEEEIMNPYFGDAMLHCGRIVED